MTVQELINELNKVENKELPIFVYNIDSNLYNIHSVDDTISDRVDINAEKFL